MLIIPVNSLLALIELALCISRFSYDFIIKNIEWSSCMAPAQPCYQSSGKSFLSSEADEVPFSVLLQPCSESCIQAFSIQHSEQHCIYPCCVSSITGYWVCVFFISTSLSPSSNPQLLTFWVNVNLAIELHKPEQVYRLGAWYPFI